MNKFNVVKKIISLMMVIPIGVTLILFVSLFTYSSELIQGDFVSSDFPLETYAILILLFVSYFVCLYVLWFYVNALFDRTNVDVLTLTKLKTKEIVKNYIKHLFNTNDSLISEINIRKLDKSVIDFLDTIENYGEITIGEETQE